MPDEELITVAQASRRFGLSTRQLTRLLHDAIIPGTKPGHDWLVTTSAVMEYLRQNRRPGRKPRKAGASES